MSSKFADALEMKETIPLGAFGPLSKFAMPSATVGRSLAIIAAVVMLVRVVQAIFLFNNTCDEPFHIASAVVMYDVGKEASGVEQPPLTRIVAGLPLHLRGVRLPPAKETTAVVPMSDTYSQGTQILFHSRLTYRQVLTTARLSMLVFPLIALFYLYLLAAWIGNELIAGVSVVFFSLDPALLGHSSWVHTDVAACAGFLAAAYHGLRWIFLGGHRRAVLTGMAIGAATAAKFSCLFILPAIALVLVLSPLLALGELPKTLMAYFRRWPSMGQMATVALVAFFTLWSAYFFNVDRLSNQSIFVESRSEFQRIPLRIRSAEIPMPSFALGLMKLVSHNRAGNNSYLNGRFSDVGWWYYFPEAIAIKEPLALLAGLLAAGLLLFVRRFRPDRWRAAALLILPAVFLAAAMMGHLDIGIRHVLPVLPFLYLLVCFQLARAGAGGFSLLGVLIVTAMIESAWIAPNYTEFFNAAAGGPERGAQYLIDSNIDFGQDVARLAEWLHSDQARARPYSLRLFMFPDKSLCRLFGLDPSALFRNSNSGLLAISKNVRYGLGAGATEDWLDQPKPDYRCLSSYPIVKKIGYSIDVYDLDAPLQPQSRPSATHACPN
jgi:hypothetical protein